MVPIWILNKPHFGQILLSLWKENLGIFK
jgi:hypothetical protein